MEDNKTKEINKRGKRETEREREREREGERVREREKLGLRKVKRKSFNNHPYNQEPKALIYLKPNHKP